MNNNINNNQNYGVKLTIQQWSSDYAWGKKIFFFKKCLQFDLFNELKLWPLKKSKHPNPTVNPLSKTLRSFPQNQEGMLGIIIRAAEHELMLTA